MYFDPFEELNRLHEEMDKMFGRFFKTGLLSHKGSGKELVKYSDFRCPTADIRETENNVIAAIELPGVDKQDIDLNVTDNAIEVKVEKKSEREHKGKDAYSYESQSSHFYRRLPLPAEVDASKANASYKNGLLRVEIPKLKQIKAKTNRIDIK